LRLTGRGQDDVRYPMKLMARLGWLAEGITTSDFAPTSQQKEVLGGFKALAAADRGKLTELLTKEVAGVNQKLRERGVQNIGSWGSGAGGRGWSTTCPTRPRTTPRTCRSSRRRS